MVTDHISRPNNVSIKSYGLSNFVGIAHIGGDKVNFPKTIFDHWKIYFMTFLGF